MSRARAAPRETPGSRPRTSDGGQSHKVRSRRPFGVRRHGSLLQQSGRAHAQTALEKRLVRKGHVNRDEHRRDHECQEECPSLPVIERPCRDEDDGEEHHCADECSGKGSEVKVVHGILVSDLSMRTAAAGGAYPDGR